MFPNLFSCVYVNGCKVFFYQFVRLLDVNMEKSWNFVVIRPGKICIWPGKVLECGFNKSMGTLLCMLFVFLCGGSYIETIEIWH